MQNIFIFPDGRKYALFYSPMPKGAIHRQDTPLRSPQDIDALMSYLGGARLAQIWQDYYLNHSSNASPAAPQSQIRTVIQDDLWKGKLYFIPHDDPEDQPDNLDQAIRTARAALNMHLRGIIQEEQREKAALEKEYSKLNTAEKALVSTGAAATGLGKAAKDFLMWADNIVDVVDMNRRAVRVANAARKTYWEHNNKSWGENIAEAEYKELVEALGFDPAKISREQIKQAIEFSQLIWEDNETRDILKQFAIDYARAQHHTEWTEMAGGLSFEIILTLILAALTGGAGAAAAAAKNMMLIGRLEKAGQALLSIGKKLKNLKVRAKRKLISVKDNMTSSGPPPKSKHDKADDVMHQANTQNKSAAQTYKSKTVDNKPLSTNPKDIRAASKSWPPEKQARFATADNYYKNAGYSDYDSHLRGIDFDQPVDVTEIKKGDKLYQYSYLDRKTGQPKVGSYYYNDKNVDHTKLGFDIQGRKMIELEVQEPTTVLKSKAANIEDWNGTDKIFPGGETQLFNPKVSTSTPKIVN